MRTGDVHLWEADLHRNRTSYADSVNSSPSRTSDHRVDFSAALFTIRLKESQLRIVDQANCRRARSSVTGRLLDQVLALRNEL
jgi:hypothetical protein